MMSTILIGMLVGLLVLAAGPAFGATLNVPTLAYPAIQDAIDAAVPGDVVLIADGTYTGAGNVNLDFMGKAITVRSANGPAAVIIDCQDIAGRRGFNFVTRETNASLLEGVTIRNGSHDWGAGIAIGGFGNPTEFSSPTIRNCIIENNETTLASGGGINVYLAGSNPIIENCIIRNNIVSGPGVGGGVRVGNFANATITDSIIDSNQTLVLGLGGGGIHVGQSVLTITGSTISNNSALRAGGGLAADTDSNIFMENCTISGNSSQEWGGGLLFWNSPNTNTLRVVNSLIYDNTAAFGGAAVDALEASPALINCTIYNNNDIPLSGDPVLQARYFAVNYPADMTLVNSIITNNSMPMTGATGASASVTVSWSLVDDAGIAAINNNITGDPLFEDLVAADFRLQATSPAIDVGDNASVPGGIATDRDGADRFFDVPAVGGAGLIVDMGAYEHGKGALQFASATYSSGESAGSVIITVRRSGGSIGAVSVDYATSDGTAKDGSDYTAANNTLDWLDADSADRTFTVDITNDVARESDETVLLTLSNQTAGAGLGEILASVLTIIDNDGGGGGAGGGGGGGGGGGCFISSVLDW